MKILISTALLLPAVFGFAPTTFVTQKMISVSMSDSDYDLDFGMKNDYVTQSYGDGGQGQFGAVSPNNWRQPGTSPVGENSYDGAADGGDEPWFSEAVATVFLDLSKADDTVKAFTKETAAFKMDQFSSTSPYEFTDKEHALDELVGKLGYNGFLECNAKQLAKAWDALHPKPKPPKEKKPATEAAAGGDAKKAPAKKAPAKKAPAKKAPKKAP